VIGSFLKEVRKRPKARSAKWGADWGGGLGERVGGAIAYCPTTESRGDHEKSFSELLNYSLSNCLKGKCTHKDSLLTFSRSGVDIDVGGLPVNAAVFLPKSFNFAVDFTNS
jgi:hypothetical protein